jgi:dihydrofolate reductase
MGRIVLTNVISRDGVAEDPFGLEGFEQSGWALHVDQGEDGRRIKVDEAFDAAALLFGRRTYEMYVRHLREAPDDFGLGQQLSKVPKFVVSSVLEDPEWANTTVLRGNILESVQMLRDEIEGDILVAGSISLARLLFGSGLFDEIRLMVYPVVLNEGMQLFDENVPPQAVSVAHAEIVGHGILYVIMEPREPDDDEWI